MDYRTADLKTRLTLAQANDTPVDVLAQLVDDENVEVRRAIALNPNASEEILRKLSIEFSEEVVQNPIFKILLLEHPDSFFVSLSLARSKTTSLETLERLAQSDSEDILIAIGSNPKTPAHVLTALVEHPPALSGYRYWEPGDCYYVYTAIAQNPNIPISLIRKIASQRLVSIKTLAKNPRTPADVLESLITCQQKEALLELAKNSASSKKLVTQLIVGEYEEVRAIAITHPNVPDNAEDLLGFVEGNPDTPADLVEKLSNDPRLHVRRLVVEHPNASEAALERLVKDRDSAIAYKASTHPNAPEPVVKYYANLLAERYHAASRGYIKHGIQKEIVAFVKYSKKFSSPVQVILKKIPSLWKNSDIIAVVSADVLKHTYFERKGSSIAEHSMQQVSSQSLISKILEEPRCHLDLARNPNISLSTIHRLIDTQEQETLMELAINPAIPEEILPRLSAENCDIRYWLASNDSLTVEVLERLARDSFKHVRAEIARNPVTPPRILKQLSQDAEVAVTDAIIQNPNAPAELLEQFASHPEINYRIALAQHQNASQIALSKLAEDDSIEVRFETIWGRSKSQPRLSEVVIQKLFDKTVEQLAIKKEQNSEYTEEFERFVGIERDAEKSDVCLSLWKPSRAHMYEYHVLIALCTYSETPADIREKISKYGYEKLRPYKL